MKVVSFFTLMLFALAANAQDIIQKIDQTKLSVKVTEITTDEIKFKYFNRLDGPTYALKKSEVYDVVYRDGTREQFNTATPASTSVSTGSSFLGTTDKPSVQTTSNQTTPYTNNASAGKRRGWTANLGYATPTQSFGSLNAISYGGGYFFLGSGRKGGVLFDLDVINMFGEGTPNYALLTVNGIARLSSASTFYIGGGIGYGTVSVKVKDRYGLSSTVSSGDLSGKLFLGYGMFRAGLSWPSLQGIDSEGLLMIGLSVNPFK